MTLTSRLWAILAVPLALAGQAIAAPAVDERAAIHSDFEFLPPAATALLPDFGAAEPEAPPVRLAQVADPRLTALEEQVRELTGRIEELNFLILQMQEQIRKQQEDNEFRLQQIEERRGDAGGSSGDRLAPPRDTADAVAPAEPGPSEESRDPALAGGSTTFGTITFDADGNPGGGDTAGQPDDQGVPGVELPQATTTPPPAQSATDDTVVAALPATDDPSELYRNSYNFILSGDYATAEAGFRDHIERFPGDPQSPDAHYWLGEALLGMERYRDAAEIFLAASRDFPESRKAPDMLLKLGVSLAALNQRDVACATYAEIGKRYQDASKALKDRVRQEQALAGC